MRSFFPDVNVWVALACEAHQHHRTAVEWLDMLLEERLYFCRLTQLGFLRLMTQPTVMRDEARTQAEAWADYDAFLGDARILFPPDPDDERLQSALRRLTSARRSSSRLRPDAYLAAFAEAVGLQLVTFDHALSQWNPGSVLLK